MCQDTLFSGDKSLDIKLNSELSDLFILSNCVPSSSYTSINLKQTSHCIAKFSHFILSFITLNGSTSYIEISGMHCYNVLGIVDPFYVSSSTILFKDFQISEAKKRLELVRRR